MSSKLRRTLPVTVLAVAGLLGTGLVGTAQAATTTVTGTVKTFLGTAVPGASVKVKVGATTFTGTTNAAGAFTINSVDTGAATASLANGTGPAAELPPVWNVGGISTTIAASSVLNFTLPQTYTASFELRQSGGTPLLLAGAKIQQCAPPNAANPAVVLAGSAAVAPTQDLTGTTTDANGAASVHVFADTNLAVVCATFTTSGAGLPTTDIIGRSGSMFDMSLGDAFKPITAPAVVDQTGTIKDSGGSSKADLTMAVRSGNVDSKGQPTSAAGAFTVKIDPGAVKNTWRINGRSTTGALPSGIPRIFKAVFVTNGVLGTTPPAVNVNLPATGTLKVRVINSNGSPVKGAVLRPVNSNYGAATAAVIYANAPAATLTQQVYSDGFSDNNGNVTARLFPDGNLQNFLVVKNVKGPVDRTATVAAGQVVTANGTTTVTVTLPK